MSNSKDNGGFLRKVVRFVSHPTLDWAELNQAAQDSQHGEDTKSELKASIERRKRNDFVRRREFDMLRKVRREGLSETSVGAGASLALDSEVRMGETVLRSDIHGMRAKIDAIEQQMVGESGPMRLRTGPGSVLPERPLAVTAPAASPLSAPAALSLFPDTVVPPVIQAPAGAEVGATALAQGGGPLEAWTAAAALPLASSAASVLDPSPGSAPPPAGRHGDASAPEVSEVVCDAELDDVVMAFANANFSSSESLLQALIEAGGTRAQHAGTWLVLFDLYRATGQQAKFESLALDYANRFGQSAPQWFSMPQRAAEDAHQSSAQASPFSTSELGAQAQGVSWTCPESLDSEAVRQLRSRLAQEPAPWLLNWSHLQRIAPAGAVALCETMRLWSGQSQDMRWQGGGRLQAVLQEAAPIGVRQVDPAYWLLRLEMLRLLNRPDRFDEVAIDYCLTYEMSPPAWEPARCMVHLHRSGSGSDGQPMTHAGEASTLFLESQMTEMPCLVEVASLELHGQLVGDISDVLGGLEARMGDALVLKLGCAGLIRVDFLAAGDLLNWVMTRRSEGRTVVFEEMHRLLALFFGAMGINEHAQIKVRHV